MVNSYYFPETVLMGAGALELLPNELKDLNLKKALIVTDKNLLKIGVVNKVKTILDKSEINYVVFSDVKPNPTVKNVDDGYKVLQENNCDFIISIGGGSPQDAGKGIAVLGTNGGSIKDYHGVNLSKRKAMPIVAINTTAGTASEATINYVITDEEEKLKMVIVDKNSMATIAINDADLTVNMPQSLTAATGMDALTHAIEGYISTGATDFSDMFNLEAIKVISKNLKAAYEDGENIEARENMLYGQFVTGMGFSNCGLGIVHSMAHQLGGFYDLPHGICNAILLPHIMEYNMSETGEKFINIAEAMGVNTKNMTLEEAQLAAINSVKNLSKSVGIPDNFKSLGVDRNDIEKLAEYAMNDPCTPSNPKKPTNEDIMKIYEDVF